MDETTNLKLLKVFGYTPEDLNCADANTAFGEIFEVDLFIKPTEILKQFIFNCSIEDFANLKKEIDTRLKKS